MGVMAMRILHFLFFAATLALVPTKVAAQQELPDVTVKTGKYAADWESLSAWECPEWFRDAKFGIWAHWDPQCEAEDGDWYARSMYGQGNSQWNTFRRIFGTPPSKTMGYKDLCDRWKADKWDPEALIKLYAEAGAKYFMAMGQHHDNFDCWDSPYQEWNSVNMGPKKDIVGGWAEVCRKYGLRLGVSMHGAHAWTFFEVGDAYDVHMTREDGMATNADGTFKYWWHGYDPQELYAQDHAHSRNWSDWGSIHGQWAWSNGACPPSEAYMLKFQNRVLQCIDKYSPDMIYFDDTVLPFYGASTNNDEGYSLRILQHFYNHSAELNGGEAQVVVTGKILEERHKQAMLWDVERGIPDRCQELPWQTCTCIGGWHYSKSDADNNRYKPAEQVIRMLVDIVSKNGNLLLSIPVRGNGTLDDNEKRIVAGIKAWMDINKESIYGTRPWKVYGEGPLFDSANPLNAQGFNEGINYTAEDVRYVQRNDTLFATVMCWPSSRTFTFKSLGIASRYYSGRVTSVKLLGYGDIEFVHEPTGLVVTLPESHPNEIALVLEITFDPDSPQTVDLPTLVDVYDRLAADLAAQASNNTGKPNAAKVEAFSRLVNDARRCFNAPEEEQRAVSETLRDAYDTLMKSLRNPAGSPDEVGQKDVTVEHLVERSNFSATEMGTRFGKPVHWTVENFSIPQQESAKGTKNGIDNYPGTNTLMMGKWSGEDGKPLTDMTNARIYRTVHLAAGHYFFGAAFDALYQLGGAYIYAAAEPVATSNVTKDAIAWLSMSRCATGRQLYGISFDLAEAQDVALVFQANMQGGNANQEFRVSEVRLLYCEKPDLLTQTDITKEVLVEGTRYSRVSGQSRTTRYGTPAYWTVENYTIPAGGDGTRNGLDRYPGYDCLTLGVWDDRQKSTGGDLTNARIYRKVSLEAGNYYFGAAYEANYQLYEAYIFAASETLPTADIPLAAIAYDKIADAGNDNTTFRGIYFELPEPQDVILGFQANLADGAAEQEFRVSKVKFVRYGTSDGIASPQASPKGKGEAWYDLFGRKVNGQSAKGFYILNGRTALIQ